MSEEQKTQGNPEIGMQGDSFEDVANQNTGSTEFFDQLDREVNGHAYDQEENTEATQSQFSGPEQVTHSQDDGSNNVAQQSNNGTDWQKRYTDSSREAVKWRDRFKEVEQFVPVLDAMKKDSGLVDHVREYLENGGAPAKSVQEKLGLGEDFIYDQHEAMTDPESDSAKVMNAHVDSMVNQRVGQIMKREQERAVDLQKQRSRKMQEAEFMRKNNMSNDEFEAFKLKAKNHTMTLDDINLIVNRDKVAKNVSESAKSDMLKQMKNVRNIPTSASGVNNQGEIKTEDRSVFDSILGFDNDADNLFG